MQINRSALVRVTTQIPDSATSATMLGAERTGHGVRIRADGLIVTIGYVIHEAEQVWLTSSDGLAVPGFVVGYDFDSGLGLVKPSMPLDGPVMPLGSAAMLGIGDPALIAGGMDAEPLETKVVAKEEFAGRWEYLLEEAIFTAPHHDSWSGAALVEPGGRLCGIGSLVIQGFPLGGLSATVNMFVPIDLLAGVIDEICEFGRRQAPARPWLGMLVQDEREKLLVVGVYPNCPAHKAGLRAGDQILRVEDAPVEGLAEFFRHVWSMGDAGVEIPMRIRRQSRELDTVVRSADRFVHQHMGTLQ